MSDSAVAVDLDHALDVESDVTAEVTFNVVVLFDLFSELRGLFLGEILRSLIGIDPGNLQNVLRALESDTVNVGESDLNSLVVWNINTGNK